MSTPHAPHHARPAEAPKEALDLREKGAPKDGVPQTSDKRLFMHLLAFTGAGETGPLGEALARSGLEAVLYADAHDPHGVGLLTFSEDPALFTGPLRALLNKAPFADLALKPHYSMLGRTYSLGYEPNLEDWLLKKPRRTVLNPDWPWAVWYPLRRTGAFSRLSPEEQKPIMREHGTIGHAFGDADYGHDVRLACHGIDSNDNDFVIGLVGRELFPLSALVERMRKTVQTSQYIEKMGPFFVGKALWRSRS